MGSGSGLSLAGLRVCEGRQQQRWQSGFGGIWGVGVPGAGTEGGFTPQALGLLIEVPG